MVMGIELFLFLSRRQGGPQWTTFVLMLAGFGVMAMGPPLRRAMALGIWTRLGAVLLLGGYITTLAFIRYPGLAKDIEPTAVNVFAYFGRIAAALSLAVLVASLPRLVLENPRFSAGKFHSGKELRRS
ncbi:MAG: hypothetical protein PVG07_09120 [Acidobacteriota bacterium]